jgi:uncharacterized 2Fe-2S/4Fe-4S cluster protein (DUF4445 family)
MMMKYKVLIQPAGKTVVVEEGCLLGDAALKAGVSIVLICGGKGTCGKCRVRIIDGECISGKDDNQRVVKKGEYALACQSYISSDVTFFVEHIENSDDNKILTTGNIDDNLQLNPYTEKQYFALIPASREDTTDDCMRLKSSIRVEKISFSTIQKLPTFLRTNDWKGTAVIVDNCVVSIEAGNTEDTLYGVAIDLGSTTIVAVLYNLKNGEQLNTASDINSQVKFGDDVCSRISHALDSNTGFTELQSCATNQIDKLISKLLDEAPYSIKPYEIYDICLAGNATMQQIFLGIDVSPLGQLPFVQGFSDGIRLTGKDIGLSCFKNSQIFVFPQIASFLGGDTSAGILAENLKTKREQSIFVDIGTNGEIVFSDNGKQVATSTAAGPAFEGASITDGMRATHGAIDKISYDGDLQTHIIGDADHPIGLCGTAVIDCIAILLELGIIDETGLLLDADERPEHLPLSIKGRIQKSDNGQNFFVIGHNETGGIIALYQKDIREIQLGAGALRSGINILLKNLDKTVEELDSVYIAGGFGNYLNIKSAQRIGLLPNINIEKIEYVGNSSLKGAIKTLIDASLTNKLDLIIADVEHIDLSMNLDFQMEFANAMIFPEA